MANMEELEEMAPARWDNTHSAGEGEGNVCCICKFGAISLSNLSDVKVQIHYSLQC